MRRSSWWMVAAAMLLQAALAQAQFAVYGKFDATHLSDSNNNIHQWTGGGGVGIYDDFIHLGPLHAGLDLRGDATSGGNYSYRSGLAGIRVGAKLPVLPFRPYVQGSVGVGGTKYNGALAAGISSSSYQNKFLYEILGGLDFTLLPHIDFRAIEVGVGRQSPVGSTAGAPSSTLVLLSTGLVVRL